jgi:hypothetical protein
MLGMSTVAYAISGITPKQSFTNIRSICWDQNLSDLGAGKWFVVTVVPHAEFISHPNLNPRRTAELEGPYRLDYTIPEFDGEGPGGFNLQNQTRWQLRVFRHGLTVWDNVNGGSFDRLFVGYQAGNDVATRYRHCLTENAQGQVVITQQNPTGVLTLNTGLRFPDGEVHVIFADDTYNDLKHDPTPHKTWHVDNIEIR